MDNLDGLKYYLTFNEQVDPREGYAPRNDTYTPDPHPYGAIDCKILTPQNYRENVYWVKSSPPTSDGRFPIFDWSKFSNYPHAGMPQVFNFTWVKVPIDYEKSL